MKTILANKYLSLICRMVLGALFIFASSDKIFHPADFSTAVSNYRLLPDSLINLVAIILPWLEFFCGLFLILGFWTEASVFWINILLLVFLSGILSAMIRGLDIDCGCFGTGHSAKVGWSRVGEDIGMLLLGIQIFLFDQSFWSLDQFLAKQSKSTSRNSGDL